MPRTARTATLGAILVLATAGAALAAGPTLFSFLLRSGEQPGFSVTKGSRHVQRTAAAYVKWGGETGQQAQKDTQALKAAGFERAVDEQLHGKNGKGGFSLVVKFKHHAGAKKLAAVLIQRADQGNAGAMIKPFSVPGIPSAHGMTATLGQVAVANVYWTEGRCTFGSGLLLPEGSTLTAKKIAAPVIRGIRSQHARTGGKCPA